MRAVGAPPPMEPRRASAQPPRWFRGYRAPNVVRHLQVTGHQRTFVCSIVGSGTCSPWFKSVCIRPALIHWLRYSPFKYEYSRVSALPAGRISGLGATAHLHDGLLADGSRVNSSIRTRTKTKGRTRLRRPRPERNPHEQGRLDLGGRRLVHFSLQPFSGDRLRPGDWQSHRPRDHRLRADAQGARHAEQHGVVGEFGQAVVVEQGALNRRPRWATDP